MTQRPRVLIVDDDQSLLDLLTTILSDRYDCVAVDDGSDAILVAQEQHFDAVVLDVMMPVVDGFDVLRAIRENPDLATLPVVVLSARGEAEWRLAAEQLGSDAFLTKPYEPQKLEETLAGLLAARTNSSRNSLPD